MKDEGLISGTFFCLLYYLENWFYFNKGFFFLINCVCINIKKL